MTVEQIITLIISGIISAVISTVVSIVIKREFAKYTDRETKLKEQELRERREEVREIVSEAMTEIKTELTSLKEGSQALLRSKLYNIYDDCKAKGYATIDEKNNFENIYKNYHALGSNGVMDSIREEFLDLPSSKPVPKATKRKLNENK